MELILHELQGLKHEVCSLKDDVHLIKDDVHSLKDDVHSLKDDVHSLKDDVHLLKEGQVRLENRMGSVEAKVEKIDKIDSDLQELKGIAQGTFEQVGLLTEFRTETNKTLTKHGKILDRLAARSLEQEADIINLKLASTE